MRTRGLRWLVLAICTMAGPASAQDAERPASQPQFTRADLARAARQARERTLAVYEPGRVEWLLNVVETSPFLRGMLGGRDGLSVRIGGIENGSGLAVGPAWRTTALLDGSLHAGVSAAAAINGDREVDGRLALPHLAPRLSADLEVAGTSLAGEPFFGLGRASARLNESAFGVEQRRFTGSFSFDTAGSLRLTSGTSILAARSFDGTRRGVPGITSRYSSADAPALGQEVTLHVLSFGATVDRRDVPGNPRRGGRYHVGISRYVDASHDRYTFTRVDMEVEQHLSAWKRQRVLTLRAITSASMTDAGQDVPFYLQPTLGGSRYLRGFVTDRFRDRNLALVQAEYGFDLLPFVNAVLFYETGAVAPRWQDLSLGNLRRDYGLGFRFGGARAVAVRTDVAFGSGEGTRLTMRFGHAF
jgi:hypothetical protein